MLYNTKYISEFSVYLEKTKFFFFSKYGSKKQKNLIIDTKKLKLAYVINTYSKISDAKAQMDIIREVWGPLFKNIDIYHEYNGKKDWYPKKYKETFLFRHKAMPHLLGASYLINQGVKHVLSNKEKYDYIVISSADAWLYNPRKIKEIILDCKKHKYEIATSLWHGPFLSTEFFMISPRLAKKIFPLKFKTGYDNSKLVRWVEKYIQFPLVEGIFTLQYIKTLKLTSKLYLIPGRRIVFQNNRFQSGNFYSSHHDLQERKKTLQPQLADLLYNHSNSTSALREMLSQTI